MTKSFPFKLARFGLYGLLGLALAIPFTIFATTFYVGGLTFKNWLELHQGDRILGWLWKKIINFVD